MKYTIILRSLIFLLILTTFSKSILAATILFGIDQDTLVTINLDTGLATNVGMLSGFGFVDSLAFDATQNMLFGADIQTDELVSFDLSTGIASPIGALGFDIVSGLTFDSTGTLFGVDSATDQLLSINTSTGMGTAIGEIGFVDVNGLAIDQSTNTLFGVNSPAGADQLVTINSMTGLGTAGPILNTGDFGEFNFSLAFNPSTNMLLLADNVNEELYSANPVTGESVLIGPLGPDGQIIRGLAFATTVPIPGAVWLFGSVVIGMMGWSRRRI